MIAMKHELKTWPEFFQPVKRGEKTFEIRENDRDFQVGDELWLREYVPPPASDPDDPGIYTGDHVTKRVTYMTTFGQSDNRVVLAISDNSA